MLIGYARVSTQDQNVDLQKDALTQAECKRIFIDQISGSTADRSGLNKAMEVLREGDTLVVWRLDRLGRSLSDLLAIVAQLKTLKVGLRSLQEAIDTASPAGTLIFHIFGALAEFERNLIKERTLAGLVAARSRGRKGGRPKSLDLYKRKVALKLYQEGKHSGQEIADIMNISRGTLYNYLKEGSALN